MPLPRFSVDIQVSPETGREDKLEIDFGCWIVHGSPFALDQVRSFIASPPDAVRLSLNPGDPHRYGWIFRRPSNPGIRREHLAVRKRAVEGRFGDVIAERLLFAGKWKLAYRTDTPQRDFPTFFALSLNPLRYLRYQPIPHSLPAPNAADWPRPNLLLPEALIDEQNRADGDEFSLDGGDNWLRDTPEISEWASPARWYRHLNAYMRGVANAFTLELRRATRRRRVRFDFVEDFTIRKVETIWEFAADEPTELVGSLVSHLQAYRANTAEIQSFPVQLPTRQVNSISFTMKLSANVSLRLYAKTNRRIRFEIIHEKINHRELYDEPVRRRGASAVQYPRPWENIEVGLPILRERAAVELNNVLRFLAARMSVERSHISGFSLMMRIGAILRDEGLALTVVSLLVHNRLIEPRGAERLQNACSLLGRGGVLAFDYTARVWRVTPPYDHALSLLSAYTPGRLLSTARERHRSVFITEDGRRVTISARRRER